MTKQAVQAAAVWLCLVGVAAAQVPQATASHEFVWDQTDSAGLTYELALDGQPYAPLLSSSCAGTVCRGPMIQSIAPGRHAVTLRSVRVVDGVRQVSPASTALTFDFVGPPPAPGGLRLEVPPGAAGVVVRGTVQQRYPFAGLDVAGAWLDSGDWLYVGAQRLSVPGYQVQTGDTVEVALWRR